MLSPSYPFHNLRTRKLKERDFRSERSRCKTSEDRLSLATDRVQDTRALLQWRVDTNRTDESFALGTLVVPNGGTGFDL